METYGYCGGCGGPPVEECRGSLSDAHVAKVHWECWSDCNLECGFCYRTTGESLRTESALLLIRAVRTGGVNTLVLAGGDPALRHDLGDLVDFGHALGLRVELHTNGHLITDKFVRVLGRCDRVALSLDGPNAELHDTMRGRRGNFDRVLRLLRILSDLDANVSVRTMVGLPNLAAVGRIGVLLSEFSCVHKWRLLEFTSVERAWDNRAYFAITPEQFEFAIAIAQQAYAGPGRVDSLTTLQKVGAYVMISPEGFVYGTTSEAYFVTGRHRYVAHILSSHLADIANSLPFNPVVHQARYRT